MKGAVEGLRSPHPIGRSLPAIYRDDTFVQKFCGGLDEVVAPVINTLDSLPAYFDPATAPDDMLLWLSSWMGIVVDRHQAGDLQRQLVKGAADLLRWRGTVRGMRDTVRAFFGTEPEISESGGAGWSERPTGPIEVATENSLLVRLQLPRPTALDRRRLDELVDLVKPAHIPHRAEIVATDPESH